MRLTLRNWFEKVWTQSVLRVRVAGEYASLRQSRHMLADIAARNFVFAELPNEPHAMAVAEGRRRAALEILELARADFEEIAGVKLSHTPREPNNAAI